MKMPSKIRPNGAPGAGPTFEVPSGHVDQLAVTNRRASRSPNPSMRITWKW
jgi:hypothetical protein